MGMTDEEERQKRLAEIPDEDLLADLAGRYSRFPLCRVCGEYLRYVSSEGPTWGCTGNIEDPDDTTKVIRDPKRDALNERLGITESEHYRQSRRTGRLESDALVLELIRRYREAQKG